jgi:hypothetical protein
VRFGGRLARLARLAALLPPADPLADLSDEEMERAARVIEARLPMSERDQSLWRMRGIDPETQRARATPEEEAWFGRAVEPRLPQYLAYEAALDRWQLRLSQASYFTRERLACIFPAFAGEPGLHLRIASDLLHALAPTLPRQYEPGIP